MNSVLIKQYKHVNYIILTRFNMFSVGLDHEYLDMKLNTTMAQLDTMDDVLFNTANAHKLLEEVRLDYEQVHSTRCFSGHVLHTVV